MANHDLHSTRSIGIMAYIDVGKTTASERILSYTGKTYKIGEIHDGAVAMDWIAQEQECGIIVTPAATTRNWNYLGKSYKINLIGTPRHVDFTAEAERPLRVLDGAVATYSTADGIQPQSETVRRQVNKYNVPCIGYINKMDRFGADFYEAVQQMKDTLGANPTVIRIPIGAEENFKGVADLIKMKATLWHDETMGAQYDVGGISADLADEAAERREKLFEGAVNYDDELMEMYLEGQGIPEDKLIAATRKGCIAMECCLMLLGSSYKNKGAQSFPDYICVLLPPPLDTSAIVDINPDTEEEEDRKPSESESTSALAFKAVADPFMGRLVFLRVYSGKAAAGSYVFNTRSGRKERASRLFRMNSNKEIPMGSIGAGDIDAGVGFEDIRTGDTLCDESAPVILESITFLDTVISTIAKPKSQADVAKLDNGFSKLAEEDPTFTARTDEQSGQTIISGMGEPHLNIIIDRLKRELKVECSQDKLQANYKEIITKAAQSRETYKKQFGGCGKFAYIDVTIEPKDEDHEEGGLQFVNVAKGGNVSKEFTPAVEKGFKDCLGNGVFGGFPMTDLKVTSTDGSFHLVDPDQLPFELVVHQTFKVLRPKAGPVFMEPIMKVGVVTPERNMGGAIGDLNKCRGLVQGMGEARNGARIIRAMVPLSEVFGYATALRTITPGRATSSMEYDHHSLVLSILAKEILDELKGSSDLTK